MCPNNQPKEPCEAQYEEFSAIFTWFLLTGSLSSMLLEPIHNKFGTFVIRIILGTMTTGGIVILLFYEENNYLIWAAWQLIGLPSVMYIIINIKGLISKFFIQKKGFLKMAFEIYSIYLIQERIKMLFTYQFQLITDQSLVPKIRTILIAI